MLTTSPYFHNNDVFCLPLFFVRSVAIVRFVVCPYNRASEL